MMHIAMELEEPILEYSRQNGQGFRFLLPSLGRFMGMNPRQTQHAGQTRRHWCESPWCAEEKRHAGAFARVIERLTRTAPSTGNPNRPMIAAPDEAHARRLLVSREAAEWNSSSGYSVMAAHSTGELHALIRNVARDEIKHLSILSSASLYLFGPRPWRRFAALLGKSLAEYRGQKARRSRGGEMGSNPITAFEVVACHLLTEFFIRRWLRSLSPRILASTFETSATPPEPADAAAAAARRTLARWDTRSRRKPLLRQAFDEANALAIEHIETTEFDGFRGARIPGSRGEKQLMKRIGKCRPSLLRACLSDRLRHYQIQNSRRALASPER